MSNTVKLTETVIAVEVEKDSYKFRIKEYANNAQLNYEIISKILPRFQILPKGYTLIGLLSSALISEEMAEKVVEQPHYKRFKDYAVVNMVCYFHDATYSLKSLITSKSLDQNKHWLLLKKDNV